VSGSAVAFTPARLTPTAKAAYCLPWLVGRRRCRQRDAEEVMDGVTISSSPSSNLSTAGPSGMKLSVKPSYVSHQFAAKVKALGLPPARFHDLRHGAATSLVAGVDLKTVQAMKLDDHGR
jgi:integrase